MPAPVTLFVYARPDHTRRTVQALQKNELAEETDLIVYSDAARSLEKEQAVGKVREYVAGIQGFKSLTVYHRSHNYGLAKSIIEGVTEVVQDYGRVIVLEDDMVTSRYFLAFMNEALDRYEEDDRVISAHGWMYPVADPFPKTFFLRGADCWGWATWRRGWELFNPDGQYLLDELKRKKLLKDFDYNGAYGYSAMLEGQIKGLNDSWAVRWHASAFLANKLTLYPGRSLVHNIGNESSGTHCGTSGVFDTSLSEEPIRLDGVVVEESEIAKSLIEKFLRSKFSLSHRVLARVLPTKIRNRMMAFLKDWLPPAVIRLLRRGMRSGGITFEGPFSSWEEAVQRSSGYGSEQILEKVLDATLKVKNGEAAYERDSVVFDEIQYAWPVTAGLMSAAAHNRGRLSVLDFGGSLGSSYFQSRKFLDGLEVVRWSVIEQPHFVESGQAHIQDARLKFYCTIEECLSYEKPNVVVLSGVLQYLEEPYVILDKLMNCGAEIILIDRTSFFLGRDDLILTQSVPASIYMASYPMWVFAKEKFISHISLKFYIVAEYLASEGYISFGHNNFSFNGYIFQRRLS